MADNNTPASQAPPPLPPSPAPPEPVAQTGENVVGGGGTTAILVRLKELESANQSMAKGMDDLRQQLQVRDDKIKDLSADKRKEMEQLIDTAIDKWLGSLTGISEDVKKQFRSGISKLAEHADVRNSAWEVVCQASALHQANVNRIEQLISQLNEQETTIKSLVGGGGASSTFSSEDSRVNKRTRREDEPPPSAADINTFSFVPPPRASETANSQTQGGEAWDMFNSLMHDQARSTYY